MRIATYNIWNSENEAPRRFEQLVDQIEKIEADVICLQEVKDKEYHTRLDERLKYPHSLFLCHDNEEEGLSVLSQYPLEKGKYISGALITALKTPNGLISIANVHLSWKSALKREQEITEIEHALSQEKSDYRILLGDFNCSSNSSVHQYLLGGTSLSGSEANPYWYDLAESYADKTDSKPEITLDFQNNPRWQGKNTIETNQRFDRIYLQNTYPNGLPILKDCTVYGREISHTSGLAPSDHYGVYVDLDF